MANSTGNEPKHVGSRPVKGLRNGITGPTPNQNRTPQAVKTRRGAAHTSMMKETPSGKGQKRHYG